MSPDKKSVPELPAPLDLTRFPEKDGKAFTECANALAQLDSASIEEYLAALKRLPDGIRDNEHFGVPSRYSLIAWGKRGIDTRYRLCTENALEAGYEGGKALFAVAQ